MNSTANSITLAVGPAATPTSITITPTTIALSIAGGDVATLKLDTSGVLLSTAAGSNKLQLTQTGQQTSVLQYKFDASANAAAQFLLFDQTVTAALKTAVGIEQEQ
jgi:hypothetical protein